MKADIAGRSSHRLRRPGRHLGWPVCVFIAFSTTACVVPPPAGTPSPPRVEILMSDSHAARYGSSAAEVLSHPAVREKVRLLFGSDLSGDAERRRELSASAADFFSKSSPPRLLRIGELDYIAASGCLPGACQSHRGLLLIRADGEELLARLDEGGFTHYYAYAAGVAMTPWRHALVDVAWHALEPAPG